MASLIKEQGRLSDHLYGFHKCDIVCSDLVTIDPIDSPVLTMAEKVKSSSMYHEWITDKLEPVKTAREFILHTYDAESMRKLMTLHIDTSMVNWEEFAQNFRRLTEQFTPLPKANWWNWFGWWWRKPYGWLLTQKRHLRNILVGWRASHE